MKAISFDVDGVLSVWPLGMNPGISPRPKVVAPLATNVRRFYKVSERSSRLGLIAAWLRFAWRRPDPEAREVLRVLSQRRHIVITTGRSVVGQPVLEAWLRWHGLVDYVKEWHLRPPGLSERQHKLATLGRLGIDTHVDDDPTTIWYLAENGIACPSFREWPKTVSANLPAGVQRVRRLSELLGLPW